MVHLLAIALLPCIFLMYKIYKADKIEKEPPQLLIKIFIRGVISAFLAMILETIGTVACAYIGIDLETIPGMILMYFVIVAVSEELVKRWAMKKPTWTNPDFNYLFDGVVYGVTASIGFAALENVMYVFEYGFEVGIIRAITSIPLHCICGIYMGLFYGRAKYFQMHRMPQQMNSAMRMSLLIPVLIHGFYDFAASVDNDAFTIIFLAFIIIMEIMTIFKVKKYSREDRPVSDQEFYP